MPRAPALCPDPVRPDPTWESGAESSCRPRRPGRPGSGPSAWVGRESVDAEPRGQVTLRTPTPLTRRVPGLVLTPCVLHGRGGSSPAGQAVLRSPSPWELAEMWREGPTDAGAALGRGEEDGGLPPAPSSPSLSVYTPAVVLPLCASGLSGEGRRGLRGAGVRSRAPGPGWPGGQGAPPPTACWKVVLTSVRIRVSSRLCVLIVNEVLAPKAPP